MSSQKRTLGFYVCARLCAVCIYIYFFFFVFLYIYIYLFIYLFTYLFIYIWAHAITWRQFLVIGVCPLGRSQEWKVCAAKTADGMLAGGNGPGGNPDGVIVRLARLAECLQRGWLRPVPNCTCKCVVGGSGLLRQLRQRFLREARRHTTAEGAKLGFCALDPRRVRASV